MAAAEGILTAAMHRGGVRGGNRTTEGSRSGCGKSCSGARCCARPEWQNDPGLVFAVSTMTPDEAPVEPPERAINAK